MKTQIVQLTPDREDHQESGRETAFDWRRTRIGSWPLLLIVATPFIAVIGLILWLICAVIRGGK